ncbi:hypothetical protein C8R47DRAFT_536048 [Mycena vitilis]|nr:hypothetical protein C8R47DRAFT_536048 [Mycena vitilis]
MPSLPDLPTELLMEIVSYYPELYLFFDACTYGVPHEQFSGKDSLRALSQTSRVLRDIFLPALWSRAHACFTSRNRPKRKIKTRAKMLERRMRGIRNTTYIVPYIHSLCITLEECNMYNWQPMAEFIRVLDLLPNLRELTILQLSAEMVPVFQTSCDGKIFPSVLRLALSDGGLAPLLRYFPNVQTLTCYWYTCGAIVAAAKEYCRHVHTVNNMWLSAELVKCLRDAIPQLKQLSIWDTYNPDTIRLLEGMDNLSDLRIRHPPEQRDFNDVVAAARHVLRTSRVDGRKELRMQEFASAVTGMQKEVLIVVGGAM